MRHIQEYIKEHPTPRDSICGNILRLETAMAEGRSHALEAIRAAREVALRLEPPELVFMFLWAWRRAARTAGRIGEAEALLRSMRSMVAADWPEELRAVLHVAEAMSAYVRGHLSEMEKLLERSFRILSPESPRRDFNFLTYVRLRATSGRLPPELEAELEEVLARTGGQFRSLIASVRFFQYAETLRFGEAETSLRELQTLPGPHSMVRESVQAYEQFFVWSREQIGPQGSEPSIDRDPKHNPDSKTNAGWQETSEELLRGRAEAALEAARAAARVHGNLHMQIMSFPSFVMIRAELANGNGQAARRLLAMRQARGAKHYLDDFFLARADLLAGDRQSAARRFTVLQKSIRKYKAQGRLDLELRLACELSPADAVAMALPDQAGPAAGSIQQPTVRPDTTVPEATGSGRILGNSEQITAIRAAVGQLAGSDVPVLITGETGTGKELVARALHEEGSRRGEPFIAVNCAAIAESLLESELFGHASGAFTGASKAHRGVFEVAGKGSILLDEVGEMPARLQAALLRVLENSEVRPVGVARTRKIECRVLAATNADLGGLVESGTFRRDLFFRLRRLTVSISPLRERREDILPLAGHYLDEGRPQGQKAIISAGLRKVLLEHDWPGNVRELRNEVERMRIMNSDGLQYDLSVCKLSESGPENGSEADREGPAGVSHDSGSTATATDLEEEGSVESFLSRENTPLRRLDRLQDLFVRCRKLTRSEVARILGVSPRIATRDLKKLCALGFIEKVMPNRSPRTHYFRLLLAK